MGEVGPMGVRVVYRSCLKSLGAAHAVAQWARWKTRHFLSISLSQSLAWYNSILTFLNTVLVGLAVLLLLLGDALDAVVVVVLVGSALG
jgi:hypothetical protein